MDIMTQIRLIAVGGVMMMYGLALGAAVVLGRLLQRRERRQTALRAAVLEQLSPETQGRIEAHVHYSLFGHAALVNVRVKSCAPGEIWGLITRLSQGLSPDVRLLVCRADDLLSPVMLTVKPHLLPGRPST
jgi:hypothetical protein